MNGLQVVTPRATIEASATRTPSLASVARRLGANTLLAGSLQRENDRFRITYRLLDASGTQIAANAHRRPGALRAPGPRRRRASSRTCACAAGAQRTPTPSGLDTPARAGALPRGGRPAAALRPPGERRAGDRRSSASSREERPNSALVQAALARADLAMYRLHEGRELGGQGHRRQPTRRARLDPELPEVDVTPGETLLADRQCRTKPSTCSGGRSPSRPGDVEALLGLGRAARAAGDTAAAEAALRAGDRARSRPSPPSTSSPSSTSTSAATARPRTCFGAPPQPRPDSYAALSNLGGAETMRCNYPAALDAYRKALALDPKNPSAASNLGMTQLWTGHTGRGRRRRSSAPRRTRRTTIAIWGNLGDAYRRTRATPEGARRRTNAPIALAREQLTRQSRTTARRSRTSRPASRGPGTRERGGRADARGARGSTPKDPDHLRRRRHRRRARRARSGGARLPAPGGRRGLLSGRSSRASPSSRAFATTRTFARSSPRRKRRPAAR